MAAVERAHQRRVDGVREHHDGAELEERRDGRVLQEPLGDEGGAEGEAAGDDHPDHELYAKALPQRDPRAAQVLAHQLAHRLDGGGDQDVVQDGGRRQDGRVEAEGLRAAEEPRQDEVDRVGRDDEPDLGPRDDEEASAGRPGLVAVCHRGLVPSGRIGVKHRGAGGRKTERSGFAADF